MLKMIFFISLQILFCPQTKADFFLPSSPPDRPTLIFPKKVLKLPAGEVAIQFSVSLECAVIPDRDFRIEYSLLIGDDHHQQAYPAEPCFSSPRVYAFKYQKVEGLDRRMTQYEARAKIHVTDSPIQVQYIMKLNGKTYASTIHKIGVPAEPEFMRAWHNRPNSIVHLIDAAYDNLHKNEQDFSHYGIEDYSTYWPWLVRLVQQRLSASNQSHFRFLDLGAGDGTTLILLQQAFHLSWDQLIGISAQDYRGRISNNPIPNPSYQLFNIEHLDLKLKNLGQFDVIFSHATSNYLIDPLSVFAMAYELLKDHGMSFLYFQKEHLEANNVDFEAVVDDLNRQGFKIRIFPMDHPEMEIYGPMMWLIMEKQTSHPHLIFPINNKSYYKGIRELAEWRSQND